GRPIDDALADSIWRRSGGHPLFAEELLAAADEPGDGAPPPSLIDVLMTRVAALTPDTLSIIRTLAVAGRPIDGRLLGPLVGWTEGAVGAALREATTHGVLTALGGGRHSFRHELLREIVERDLSAGERREIHEAIAIQLVAHPELAGDGTAEMAAELARHWAAADRPLEAHATSLQAATAAEEVHAFGDAHRQLERAIGLEARLPVDDRPAPEDRIDVRRRASTAADLDGVHERAIELIRDAIALDEAAGSDPLTAGILHARLGFLTWAGGDGEAALLEHRRAVELVPAQPPTVERAHVLGGLGGALMGLGRWPESRVVCQAAIDCAVRSGSVQEEARARTMLGSDLVALGEIEAGLDELRASHRLAGSGPSELFVVSGHNLGLNLLAADRLDEALSAVSDAREAARAGGMERRFGMELAALHGDVLLRLGRWDEAETATAAGMALDPRGYRTAYLAVVRARLVARRGAPADARRLLDAIERDRLDPDLAIFLAVVTSEVALLDGRPDDALATVADAIERFGPTGDVVWGVPLVAFGLRAAAEVAEARRAAHDEVSLAEVRAAAAFLRDAAGILSDLVITASGAAWLATAKAETARLDGRVDPEPWARAIDAWDVARDAAEAAYARFRFAETALRQEGVKAAVGPELQAAWRAALSLGAPVLQAAIEVLARRARIALVAEAPGGAVPVEDETGAPAAAGRTRPAARPTHGLSAREIEVLRLVAAGRSNGEIGDLLFITRKTAGVHVTHILDKLGVSNRVEAAMAAARLGLIEPDEDEPGARVS
ncbi:MAG: LuxR C-terminal-related transcriptional regulator, partial [Candidatus Limnocylindrales bacterium]